ncbi:MAG: prolipoprotein diacylglyceryl transferase [Lachnospiraceae bacterium]|nr:prolipoprotein diacylglyceryl transferase [Lachnospiraceae bacterium]
MTHLVSAIDIWFEKLGIAFSDMQKSFTLFGGFQIYFYGVIIALAVMVGLFVATRVAKKTGQNPERYMELVIFAIIFGVIGARLYYVIFAWDEYKNDLLQIFNLRAGGLAIYGAVIAGGLTAYVYSRRKKLNPLLVLDTACCGLIAGQCLGRWSNFINMEAFGGYTEAFTAMRLNAAKLNPNMLAGYTGPLIEEGGVTYIQVHPTFLYESLWSLMVLVVLLLFTKRKKFHGQIFLMYLAGYGLGRFWIEGLRTDQLKIGSTGIAVSQLLSALIVLGSAALMILLWQKRKKGSLRPIFLLEGGVKAEERVKEEPKVQPEESEAQKKEAETEEAQPEETQPEEGKKTETPKP